MILLQTDSMTHSPMHGKERRAVDSSSWARPRRGPEARSPSRGRSSAWTRRGVRGDATEDLAARG